MARSEATVDYKGAPARIPRPVPRGTESVESLGSFIDDVVMGHARTDRRVAREMEHLLLAEDEAPQDPPPSEAPPPVPGGDEPVTKGGKPDGEKR